MEKISWTDHVRNKEVLLRDRVRGERVHGESKWEANSGRGLKCSAGKGWKRSAGPVM
jgi:hypothetical protein